MADPKSAALPLGYRPGTYQVGYRRPRGRLYTISWLGSRGPPSLSSMLHAIRFDPTRIRLLILALPLGLAGAGAAAHFLFVPHQSPAPPAANGPAAAQQPAPPPVGGLLIEVTGAVVHPGLYRLAKGQRVQDAIAAAGGFTAQADPNRLPALAARLRDGLQVKVPAVTTPAKTSSSSTRAASVDLNAATTDELANVPGFTSELAAAAVTYRQEYGGFSSTRELVDVLGMSESDYLIARKYLHV
jgi:competence protein ComEA